MDKEEWQTAIKQIRSSNPIERNIGALTLTAFIVQSSQGWGFEALDDLCQQAVEFSDEATSGFWLSTWSAFWFKMGMDFGQYFKSPQELLERAKEQATKFFFMPGKSEGANHDSSSSLSQL